MSADQKDKHLLFLRTTADHLLTDVSSVACGCELFPDDPLNEEVSVLARVCVHVCMRRGVHGRARVCVCV
jgi:hypothetical protein